MIFNFGKTKALQQEVADLKEQINNLIPSSDLSPDSSVWKSLVSSEGLSGVAVTEKTAMAISAVYACVGLIAGAISSLPLPVYRRTAEGRSRVEDYYLHPLLNDQAHAIWSSPVFWEYLVTALLLKGDGLAEIQRGSGYSPTITGFRPMNPDAVEVKSDGMQLWYIEWGGDGGARVIHQDDVLHIPGLGFNGLRGMSQIKFAARNSIGTAISAETYSGAFFKNGAKPDFALSSEQNITQEQADVLRNTWYDRYQGASKAHLPAVLAGGLKVEQLTMTAEDAQLIDTRKFQVEDIARFFGVPPHMIGHTESSTSWGSGVEQMSIGFVKYTLGRHLKKIEKEVQRKCFTAPGERNYFCEFNVAGLERGDIKTRNEAYRIALGRAGEPGWMTVNEVRRKENLPPDSDGDKLNIGDSGDAPDDETTD